LLFLLPLRGYRQQSGSTKRLMPSISDCRKSNNSIPLVVLAEKSEANAEYRRLYPEGTLAVKNRNLGATGALSLLGVVWVMGFFRW
jgi:hypothetical protein